MLDNNTDFLQITDNFAKTSHISSIPILEANIDFIPKVTIAIPTYKRASLLKEALDSAINQVGFDEYEIIVVDNDPERNCETEKLMLKYKNPRICYYKNAKNIGMYGNWNRCIELSNGEYLTILNDDDKLNDNYLITVNNALNSKKNIDAFITRYQVIDLEGKIISENQKPKFKIRRVNTFDLLFGNINPGSLGILFSKSSLIKIGGYDDTYYPSSDYMFLVKYLVHFNNVFYLNCILTNYRIAVNESKKIDTLQGFINIDRKIRNYFLILFPNLKYLIKRSFPVIEYNQYKTLSNFSNKFKEIHSNQIKSIKDNVRITNIIAYYILIIQKILIKHKRCN